MISTKISGIGLILDHLNNMLHAVWTLLTVKELINTIEACADPEGGGTGGSDPIHGNHKNIRSLSNTDLDPLKNHSIQCWAIIGTPVKRHFNGVSLAGR